jgi:hypothetical protein
MDPRTYERLAKEIYLEILTIAVSKQKGPRQEVLFAGNFASDYSADELDRAIVNVQLQFLDNCKTQRDAAGIGGLLKSLG